MHTERSNDILQSVTKLPFIHFNVTQHPITNAHTHAPFTHRVLQRERERERESERERER